MPTARVLATAGASSFEVEEPDTIIYRLRGTLQAHELRALRDGEWQWNPGKPYLLVLVDISGLDAVTMEARRAATEPTKGTQIRAMAIFGGSRHIRTLTDLAMRGMALLSGGSTNMRFFADEPTAVAWLHAQRPALVAAAESGR